MVAKISSGKSVKGIIHYNEHKVVENKAELLLAHRFLSEPGDLTMGEKLRRFERLQEKSPGVRTNAVHISLNFAPGEQLETDTLQAIACRYLEKIGFGEQPCLVYRHLDAAHPHLHLVTTNIRPDGSAISLHNIGRARSEPARKEVELAFGLVRAGGRLAVEHALSPASLEKACYGKAETKRTISHIVSTVTRNYNYTSLAQLNAVLGCFNIVADRGSASSRMFQRGGLVYSILDARGQKVGIPLKASALPGRPTLAFLERQFQQNKPWRPLYKAALKNTLDHSLTPPPPRSRETWEARLRQEQVQVLFRESATGNTYGLTFVDHRRKVVFNGSELGKAYSAKALLAHLPTPPQAPATERRAHRPEDRWYPLSAHAPATPDRLLAALLDAGQQQDTGQPALHPKKKKRKKRQHL